MVLYLIYYWMVLYLIYYWMVLYLIYYGLVLAMPSLILHFKRLPLKIFAMAWMGDGNHPAHPLFECLAF